MKVNIVQCLQLQMGLLGFNDCWQTLEFFSIQLLYILPKKKKKKTYSSTCWQHKRDSDCYQSCPNERTKHIEVDCHFIRNFFSTKEDYSSLHIVQSSTSGLIHQGARKSETSLSSRQIDALISSTSIWRLKVEDSFGTVEEHINSCGLFLSVD